MVEFVSYTGKYPNLCSGDLTIKVNGKVKVIKGEERFWHCGGICSWQDELVTQGAWAVDDRDIPNDLRPYAREIEECLNENVQWGHCGGCI